MAIVAKDFRNYFSNGAMADVDGASTELRTLNTEDTMECSCVDEDWRNCAPL